MYWVLSWLAVTVSKTIHNLSSFRECPSLCNYRIVFIIPPLHRRWNGGLLDSPQCLSVRPSVDKVCGNFWKKLLAQLISYLAFTLTGRVSWPLYIFMFLASFSCRWWPNIWSKNEVSGIFWKKYWFNAFHTWHLSLWGQFLDPYTFSCSQPHFRFSGGQIFGWKWGLLSPFMGKACFYLTPNW